MLPTKINIRVVDSWMVGRGIPLINARCGHKVTLRDIDLRVIEQSFWRINTTSRAPSSEAGV
jgi:hypothetical protein